MKAAVFTLFISVVAPVLRTIFFLNSEFSFGEKKCQGKGGCSILVEQIIEKKRA